MMLRTLMTNLGIKINAEFDEGRDVREIVSSVLELYDRCLEDPALARVAYGLAVGATALALNVTLKTAMLMIEHALALRGLRHDGRLPSGPFYNQYNPGADK